MGDEAQHEITTVTDEVSEIGAAERWVEAVNADGQFGTWRYAIARKISDVGALVDSMSTSAQSV